MEAPGPQLCLQPQQLHILTSLLTSLLLVSPACSLTGEPEAIVWGRSSIPLTLSPTPTSSLPAHADMRGSLLSLHLGTPAAQAWARPLLSHLPTSPHLRDANTQNHLAPLVLKSG